MAKSMMAVLAVVAGLVLSVFSPATASAATLLEGVESASDRTQLGAVAELWVQLNGRLLSEKPPTPLVEFRTPNDEGWFYTASAREARSASEDFDFIRQPDALGLLPSRNAPQPEGTVALHRLRFTERSSCEQEEVPSPRVTYIVVRVPDLTGEYDALVGSCQFEDDGRLGYIHYPFPENDEQVLLARFSRQNEWRLVEVDAARINEMVDEMSAQGYELDGPVGFIDPT